jgi:multiple sugar transport system substrate-binding protein
LGGYSANKQVLADPAFLEQTPYNAPFAETMGMVKDFYNIPIYDPLLFAARDEIATYVIGGEGDAQAILDEVARLHTELLSEAGFLE